MEYIKNNLDDIKATGYQITEVVLTGGDNKVQLLQQCNDKLKKYTDNILHEMNKVHNAYNYTSGNLQRMKRRLEEVEDENE
jgi:septation ring formation regulator EzrA